MKKLITLVAIVVGFTTSAQTEAWLTIGDQLTTANPGYTALEFDGAGNCYFAYSNQNSGTASLNVQKFNGSTWSAVGPADMTSTSFIRGKDIAMDTLGVPYVAFANGTKDLTVLRFNGTTWDTVGVANFASTDGLIGRPDIEIDPTTNRPVVAFHDDASDKLSVMSWDGATWVYHNSGQDLSTGTVSLVRLDIDNSGITYVAYADENDMLAVHSTWTGSASWNVNLVDNNTQTISALDLGSDGVYPVVSYIDLADNMVYARRYSGAPTWYNFDQAIGTADFYDIVAVQRREWDTYVGFSDTDNLYGPESFKIADTDFLSTGASASLVGSPGGLGSSTPYNMTFGLDQDDTLYVAFGNLTVEVHKLMGISQVGMEEEQFTDFEIFPNPATNQITIKMEELKGDTRIEIYSLDGRKIYEEQMINSKHEVSLAAYPQGSYFVTLSSAFSSATSKLIIQ